MSAAACCSPPGLHTRSIMEMALTRRSQTLSASPRRAVVPVAVAARLSGLQAHSEARLSPGGRRRRSLAGCPDAARATAAFNVGTHTGSSNMPHSPTPAVACHSPASVAAASPYFSRHLPPLACLGLCRRGAAGYASVCRGRCPRHARCRPSRLVMRQQPHPSCGWSPVVPVCSGCPFRSPMTTETTPESLGRAGRRGRAAGPLKQPSADSPASSRSSRFDLASS